MSLAEELMADFEEDDADDLEQAMEEVNGEGDIEEATELAAVKSEYNSVYDVAKMILSSEYRELISALNSELERTDEVHVTAPLESDPQYRLIVRLSHLAADLDGEINVIHKFVRDKYEKRFPELETLVPNPLEYLAAVKLLGNEINTKGQNKELLGQILAPATCIVVSVTASTTQGKSLEPEELNAVREACDLAEKLHSDRISMYRLIELRMALIAPNLVHLLGAATTALLVSQAGGLAPLSRMPACNIQVLGRQRRSLAGFSSTATLPHAGFVYFHPLVQSMPPDLKSKAAKILASKCTLAARVDSLHESPNGAIGMDLLEQVRNKMEKLMEPPPVKANKALPKPLDKASKKRGGLLIISITAEDYTLVFNSYLGRRVRKMKERMGMTDLRKSANRMNFGELTEDVLQDHMGFDLGQVKSGGISGGRIRAGVVDNKTRVKMSQKMQRQMERQRAQGGVTSIRSKTAGTASSVTFTPVQGLEIINPTALEKTVNSSSTYFSSSASFVKITTPGDK
ncbi:snoRNA binding domain protein [Dictyocaulus viviparus]|uniref:U4/U6 small nuclear ribonucleoprotein Prp31 n=1 Tax=Dictyocaulus viviparus TaxID=29172 RepID=A0A0D8YBG5_DICVI|nr:snoRNA binding domain protein [Dictyocaulus viviparus]